MVQIYKILKIFKSNNRKYILEIKMNKSSLDKLMRMQGQAYGELVSLDYKSQSMHKFLHNLVNLVNQHGHRLNQLQSDKITVQRIRLASKLSQTVLNNLPNIHRKPNIETYQDTIQDISVNMKLQSQSIQFLYDSLKKKQQQLSHFNSKLIGFQKSQESAESLRKAIQGNKKYTDEQIDKLLSRIKQIEGRTNKKIGQYENVTKQIQKKTLWKINQCQSSLLKKVTPEYVEKALEQFQSRIHNDIKNNKNQELNQIKFNLETYKNKLDSLNKNMNENQKQIKIMARKLQESLKYLQTKQNIEHDKQQIQQKIKQVLNKIERLQRRQDPSILDDKFTKTNIQLFEKLALHIEKIKEIQFQMQSIQGLMKSMSVDGIDPHKICTIDGDVRRLKDTSQKNESKIQSLQEQTKTKLLIFEQRVTTALSFIKSQDNYVNKEELSQNLCKIREPITEKMFETQNLIHELNGKLAKLQLFQKATKRKIKELTRGEQFNKILDMKLGVDQAETQFYAINAKLQSLEDVFNKIKIDIQSKSQFLQFLEKSVNEPEEGINFIGTNKQKVFPAKCLGCGTKHNPVHENNLMMGTDGKYYKVDLNNYVTQQRQVFGVLPSQLAGYDPDSTTKKAKLPINRPISSKSKSNLRPSSAKISSPYL